MKKRRILFIAATMASALPAAAQQDAADDVEFCPHAYIQAHGGAQYTLGEAPFGDLVSPTVQLGVGYRFLPWMGARLAVGAWQSKGGFNGYTADGPSRNVTYSYNYVAPALDVVFDLTSAIGGFNPSRLVSVTAFVGGGVNIGFGNDEAGDIARRGYRLAYLWDGTKVLPVGRAGLGVDFRLSDAVSLGIEGNANITSDEYNSKDAAQPDWYFNVMAGIKVNLGKTHRKRAAEAPVRQPEPVEQPAPPVSEAEPAPAPKPEAPATMRRDVFFLINSARISDAEGAKLAELAAFLKANPKLKVKVTGYADADTGTDAINDRLSRQRAEAVAKALTGVHGIDASRIEVDSKGARVQPFAENDKNRVTICVAE